MRTYKSYTYNYTVGCGEFRVTFVFKTEGAFHCILAELDNYDTLCGGAYLEALLNTLTFAIRRRDAKKGEISSLIKNLCYQRCSKGIASCPDAIGKALRKQFKDEL